LTFFAPSPARASFTWAANSWGECNTKHPFADGYRPVLFNSVVVPRGRSQNYSGAMCRYYGYNGRVGWIPFTTGVNWNRACSLDANGQRFRMWVRPDYTVWCTV
jgi:hypothetical protein